MNILNPVEKSTTNKTKNSDHKCGLLRLFQSPLFDMDLAIQYLTKCKEHGVQTFIINKFFSYSNSSVDLYLPQLVCLLVVSPQIADALFAYFQYRCQNSIEFTMLLVWLLDSYTDSNTTIIQNGFSNHYNYSTASLVDTGPPISPGKLTRSNTVTNTYFHNNNHDDNINGLGDDIDDLDDNHCHVTMSHHKRLVMFRNSLINGCSNVYASGNNSSTTNGSNLSEYNANPIDFVDMNEMQKIYSIDDFSKLYRVHKRSISDMTDVERNKFNLRTNSENNNELKNGFFINDSNDDMNFNATIKESKSSLASQSVNSLPDLLSGHAFDNVCNTCQHQTTKKSMKLSQMYLPTKSTLSLPSATISSAAINKKNGKSKSTATFVNFNHPNEHKQNSDHQIVSMDLSGPDFVENSSSNYVPCNCMNYFVEPQSNFIKTLVSISRRLIRYPSKEQKTNYLRADLAHLNLNLPARVWIPIYGANHYVVRIPPNAAVCLNSKTRAPYLIYVEVVKSKNLFIDDLIQRNPISANLDKASSCSSLQDIDCSSPNILVKNCIADIHHNSNQEFEVFVAAGDIRKRLSENISSSASQEVSNVNDDPSASVLFEPWSKKKQRIRDSSPYGKIENWDLLPVIVKHGDDLRQEQLAYQVLKVLQKIWTEERCPLWLRPLTIVVLSSESGMIEPVLDAVSIHQIKRIHAGKSLGEYFRSQFGVANSETFLCAQKNFVHSLAAYCLVCYLLQVKDRHNGNILLDNEGHIIHIDYGFILSASPGRNLGFEFSPFKLTFEEVEIMGGLQSDMFEYFKILLLQGLLSARKHMDKILSIIEILESVATKFPCFNRGFDNVYSSLRDRFHLHKTDEQLQIIVETLVENSLHSLTTKLYDSYQYYTNGIR